MRSKKIHDSSSDADWALHLRSSRRDAGLLVHRDVRRDGKRPRSTGFDPGDDLESAVLMLGKRGAALDPVAAIHVADAEIVVDDGVVDVAADDAVDAVALRLGGERLFERADIVHGVLDLVLGPLRQRPIGKAEPAAVVPLHVETPSPEG